MENYSTTINGYSIKFPAGKKPFSSQLATISKVLKALKDGTNGLLESPTGTGKVLVVKECHIYL
jgi:Rad3-related DNA helicase